MDVGSVLRLRYYSSHIFQTLFCRTSGWVAYVGDTDHALQGIKTIDSCDHSTELSFSSGKTNWRADGSYMLGLLASEETQVTGLSSSKRGCRCRIDSLRLL